MGDGRTDFRYCKNGHPHIFDTHCEGHCAMSDELRERLDKRRRKHQWATTWSPDPGEMIVGTFEKMDEGETEYGTAKIAHLRDEEGELWAVWLFHTVLEDQWNEADPSPGDEVGVCYMGERDGSNFTYHAYEVEVERTDEEPEDRPPQRPDEEDSTLDGREQAERLYGGEEAENRPDSTLGNPNEGLPY